MAMLCLSHIYTSIHLKMWIGCFCTINISDMNFCDIFRVDNNLNIKIADVGFAKDVYMTDYYRQQSIERCQ